MRKEKNEPHFPQQLFLLETTTGNLYRWKHLQCYSAQNDTSLGWDAAFQNHFPLLLQPREHLRTAPEGKHINPQVKKWSREEMGRRRWQGKTGKLVDWFSLYQVWLNIEGAHCRTLRAWLQDLLSTTPSLQGWTRFISAAGSTTVISWLDQGFTSSLRRFLAKLGLTQNQSHAPLCCPLPRSEK